MEISVKLWQYVRTYAHTYTYNIWTSRCLEKTNRTVFKQWSGQDGRLSTSIISQNKEILRYLLDESTSNNIVQQMSSAINAFEKKVAVNISYSLTKIQATCILHTFLKFYKSSLPSTVITDFFCGDAGGFS